jgi:prepilin-type N-terminal cleavage/methylation domain-containing protein
MKRFIKNGFTLVELLVVIVIIAMLMGLLIPAVSVARARARQAQCANNQKELGLAVTQYQTAKRQFPGFNNVIGNAGGTPVIGSWPVTLLSYIGRNDLLKVWRQGQGFQPQNVVWVELFVCPADDMRGAQPLSYVGNCGYVPHASLGETPPDTFAPPPVNYMVVGQIRKTGIFADRVPISGRAPEITMEDVKDGAAQTLMLSERANDGVTPRGADVSHLRQYPYFPGESKAFNKANLGFVWTENDITGTVIPKQLYHVSSNHPGVFNATFCDGHQKSLNNEIDGMVYQQIMTPWGQELLIVGNANYTQRPLNEGDLGP